jgi:N-acetylmuramoyl-L-alanine amidase
MIYIPGTYFCRGKRGKSGWTYTQHAEVREKQYIEIPYRDRVRSEGLSGEFAKHLIKSLSKHRIMVHKEKPIRNHIVRRRRAYVPAVIRHNIVPTKILIEVVNLRNEADCKLVADATFRQRYANAFVDALKQYYGGK